MKLVFEFHVSRRCRDKYDFSDMLFASTGSVVFASFQAARLFAQKMNDKRNLVHHPDQTVRSAEMNAMGLIDEILHYVIHLYREQINPKVFDGAVMWVSSHFDTQTLDHALVEFAEQFPVTHVYRRKVHSREWLGQTTNGMQNRLVALEEMIMLWLANQNQAYRKYDELFNDTPLTQKTAYSSIIRQLHEFFKTQPPFGPENLNLIDLLRQPALKAPYSLFDQLEYIRSRWGTMLGDFLRRLLTGLDFLKEESKVGFFGPGPTLVADYTSLVHEYERFSPDLDWMPRVVLIAKSTLVWLDQLSRSYQRNIYRLDQIPDEELDKLARWGFTALWLIGVWERSPSSRTIKRWCGNPEAEASAYSLFDYEIAGELGGRDALLNLKGRCWVRGIRLACDMVPNHTGIDSKWMREHPDWFISLPYSPFPGYQFDGGNLSGDPRYGIYLENHYYSRTDAAVVFKRHDYWKGDVRYIYHGNDGTNMPWNDTAQLNYLNAAVREAVIQKILDVARQFPIIRFDAAMTLAKKHYQRLWFPEPGSGGDIPSRSEHGLTKPDFDEVFPVEFWREVVDRVAREVPDTLLLAEAFWLMEGYFVRTLGMHRVYNSAFMNMLKNEENEKYRDAIIKTIQFDPQILKRYVNFMNNPDEETAVAQFGNGDKYFGVCTMLVTMPGLPMIGHGQIEGLAEKYGMEYRRAYHDEQVNWYLVQRHEREIFPLIRRRYLFAEVENFHFYNFYSSEGHVNNNVFAYSNRLGGERAIVLYNNKYDHAGGWIRDAVPGLDKGKGTLADNTLAGALELRNIQDLYYVFRDQISGLEYLRPSQSLHNDGLYVELGAFKYHVFLDFYEVPDDEQHSYGKLNAFLNGRGVASVPGEIAELNYRPLTRIFEALLADHSLDRFLEARVSLKQKWSEKSVKSIHDDYEKLLKTSTEFLGEPVDTKRILKQFKWSLESCLRLPVFARRFPLPKDREYADAVAYMTAPLKVEVSRWMLLYAWSLLADFGLLRADDEPEHAALELSADWLLLKRIDTFLSTRAHGHYSGLLRTLILTQNWYLRNPFKKEVEYRTLRALFANTEVQQFIGMNSFEGVVWFNKERFEELAWWLSVIAAIRLSSRPGKTAAEIAGEIREVHSIVSKWLSLLTRSDYQVDKLLSLLRPVRSRTKKTTKAGTWED